MNKTIFIPILVIVGFLFFMQAILADADKVNALRDRYPATKEEGKARQLADRARYEAAQTQEQRIEMIAQARDYVFATLTEKIFPAWYGTVWGFNGTSRIPGEGHIACGTFVVYTLQDAGFRILSKMARQPSENIIKNLIGPSKIMRFSNAAPMERVLEWIRSQGEGLFIVGLGIHVGFIINKAGNITFCHSNYYNPPLMVVNQDVKEMSPLTDSKYRVLAEFWTIR